MNEAWVLIRNIAEVIGMFAIPLFSWVVYTLVQQGKQIIVLEQKVNDSISQRMTGIEKRVGGMEEKMEEVVSNVIECKMIAADNKNLHMQINSKLDLLASKLKS
jgi:hypothetical protein